MEKKQLKECLDNLCESTCKGAETVSAAVKAGAEKVEETAENVLAYTKAKLAVMELKSAVRTQLMQIGELVYATHTGDPTDSETMEEVLRRIDILKEEIRAKEWEMASIRGVRVCAGCGCASGLEHAYCSNCGKQL